MWRLVLWDHRGQRVTQVQPDQRGHKVYRDHKDLPALQDQWDQLGLQESRGQPDHQE